ncbi:hypothetical protein Btru_055466 [Bulinus truncatus]|nr:hypothetical protein Btru_055466 [Bulinus truncatus]
MCQELRATSYHRNQTFNFLDLWCKNLVQPTSLRGKPKTTPTGQWSSTISTAGFLMEASSTRSCGLAVGHEVGITGALVAADSGIEVDKYRQWAVEQINYILGDNPHDGGCYSYEIGYGTKYPLQPHHRAASCPSKPAPCGYTEANAPGPNPHVLIGALVGGPEENDQYVDVRSDYVLNEVACDYNSGFHGALAGIVHLEGRNQFPVTHNKCPCNQ